MSSITKHRQIWPRAACLHAAQFFSSSQRSLHPTVQLQRRPRPRAAGLHLPGRLAAPRLSRPGDGHPGLPLHSRHQEDIPARAARQSGKVDVCKQTYILHMMV